MLILDLQWMLFFALCTVICVASGIVLALSRWHRGPQRLQMAPDRDARQLLDEAPFGILILQGSTIGYANSSSKQLLRLEESAARLPSADWAEILLNDIITARNADPPGGRYRNVTFPSGRTVRWWIATYGDHDLVVLLDVSTEQRAQRASRALISDLGHELRTPIATLLTHLEILKLDDVSTEVHSQSLQLAKQEAQRMSRLVNDILELGRLEMAETLMRRPVNLVALAEDVVVQILPRTKNLGITLDIVATSTLPLVMGNEDRLRQVLLNLLDNALKYAGRGSTVSVKIEATDNAVACTVCDTGPGIPAEHLPYVTQRFYRATAPKSVEGSGLGLALVSEILRRHDSALEIISPVSQGRGTCARFVLPLAPEAGGKGL